MSEIEASLFGGIATLPRLTNLSVVIDDLLNQSIFYITKLQHGRYKLDKFWQIPDMPSTAERKTLVITDVFYVFFFLILSSIYNMNFSIKLKLIIANGYLWPKNRIYKWFFNFFKICVKVEKLGKSQNHLFSQVFQLQLGYFLSILWNGFFC